MTELIRIVFQKPLIIIVAILILSCQTDLSSEVNDKNIIDEDLTVTNKNTEKTVIAVAEVTNPDDVSHLIPVLWPGLETDLKLIIPQEYQDDNGYFLFKQKTFLEEDVEYYSDNWTRGYAGYYYPKDLEYRSIKGYGINLPYQIYGNWSSLDQEYFEIVDNPWVENESTKFKIYYRALIRTKYGIRYQKESPYFPFDKKYSNMIMSDDNLTIDEKLELIVLNHKGYLENLYNNIKPLLEIRYDLERLGSVSGATDIYLYMGGPDHFNVGCWASAVDLPERRERFIQIFAGLTILKYRMAPLYETQFIDPNGELIELILTSNEGGRAAFNYRGGSTQWRITFSRRDSLYFELFFKTMIHELTHGAIRSGNIAKMGIPDSEIKWFNDPRYNSEVITCLNDVYLFEVNNGTPYSFQMSTDVFGWDNYKGDNYENNNEALQHFFRFIHYTPLMNE